MNLSNTAHDEVDRIVQAWGRERPDLCVEPLQVLSRVGRLARHLEITRRAVCADHGLETWEFDVLTALRRAGEPYCLSAGQLLTQTLVSSGAMTNRIDRLVERTWVERRGDPHDGRTVLVHLTEAGRTIIDQAFEGLLDHERTLLEPLSATQRSLLGDFLRALLTPFDAESRPTTPRR